MAFEPEILDGTIDWENVELNKGKMFYGRDQRIYWKGCNVTHYWKDAEGKELTKKLPEWREGQGKLPSDEKLYITQGKVKEEE